MKSNSIKLTVDVSQLLTAQNDDEITKLSINRFIRIISGIAAYNDIDNLKKNLTTVNPVESNDIYCKNKEIGSSGI